MNNQLSKIQKALKAENLDGWLLCGFKTQNMIVNEMFDLGPSTRKFFIFVPTQGQPKIISSHIDRDLFKALPLNKDMFSTRGEMLSKLRKVLPNRGRIIVEISENCNLPNISLVDSGTVQLIQSLIPEIKLESSGNVIQLVQSAWTPAMIRSHIMAAKILHKIQEGAFSLIRTKIEKGEAITEKDVQNFIRDQFGKNNLITDHLPVVASGKNSSNPHFATEQAPLKKIQPGEVVLIDLWGKLNRKDAVFADITWVGFVGKSLPTQLTEVWKTITEARDAAVAFISSSWQKNRTIRGFEIDNVTRKVVKVAGFGNNFIHRTGHSIDKNVHGSGVNLDNFETHDDRKLISGAGFSIEPGIYLPKFGIRSEINMFINPHTGPTVTTQIQKEVTLL